MNRRGFLGAILAAGMAPAIVRAESLMRIWVPPQELTYFEQEISIDLSADYGAQILSMADVIGETMRRNRHLILANIMRNNALLMRLNGR